ncbi:hypothetical protein J6590_078047 [Homalodisca vitripennis]|nr:hypothetical protein J6590_078047 [Homalodisca vitripennis]
MKDVYFQPPNHVLEADIHFQIVTMSETSLSSNDIEPTGVVTAKGVLVMAPIHQWQSLKCAWARAGGESHDGGSDSDVTATRSPRVKVARIAEIGVIAGQSEYVERRRMSD